MASTRMPVPATQTFAAWAGTNVTDPTNELDVWCLGDDGKVYHYWFRPGSGPGFGWNGPEVVTDGHP